jgi:hypothetical protein
MCYNLRSMGEVGRRIMIPGQPEQKYKAVSEK